MPSILFLGPKDSLDKSRRILLTRAGYDVSRIHDIEEALAKKAWNGCALVLLSATLSAAQRKQVSATLKDAKIGVLDLAAPPRFREDGAALANHGPESFLEMVGRAVMASHGHPEIQGEIVAWVDRDRRYVHVTDGFLELIGYERDEVLGRLIDDFTYPGKADPKEVFLRYLDSKHMRGRYFLRHKSGSKVAIEYEAGVLSDGCMYSDIRPARTRRANASEADPNASNSRDSQAG